MEKQEEEPFYSFSIDTHGFVTIEDDDNETCICMPTESALKLANFILNSVPHKIVPA